jgi:hypothetical protein
MFKWKVTEVITSERGRVTWLRLRRWGKVRVVRIGIDDPSGLGRAKVGDKVRLV